MAIFEKIEKKRKRKNGGGKRRVKEVWIGEKTGKVRRVRR